MLYSYEEWIDDNGDVIVETNVVDSYSYEKLHNLFDCMEFAGQYGESVIYGFIVFWCVIYCGY